MKNKVDKESAKRAAECVKLRLDTSDYRGFGHVSDFAAECPAGDGELRCNDSFRCVSAEELCRNELPFASVKAETDGEAAAVADSVRRGERSALSIAREYISRAEADCCGTYITVMHERAEDTARKVDERTANGEYLPLGGVPLAVKDNICTSGTRTTCGSKSLCDFVPDYDATVYARLISAGAVPVGKTNLDEFAVGSDGSTSYFGTCRNPLDVTRTPGGSSSGSAASLAAGSVVIALGSDTGGSARIPASYCGLAALKPTYGSLSRFGLVGMAPSLEQICPMARNVADLRLVFEIASGLDARDMTTAVCRDDTPIKRKIGVFMPHDATPAAVRAVGATTDILKEEGYAVETTDLPYFERILGIYYTISSAEAASNLARFDGLRYGFGADSGDITDTRSDSFGARLRERLAEGAYVLTHDGGGSYAEALRLREALKESFRELFSRYDMIVTPMSLTEAPDFGLDECLAERFSVYANLTGVPAVTFPGARGECGLPVGVQLMGRHGDDIRLFDAAQTVERRLVW